MTVLEVGLRLLLALAPVFVFLVALILLDSFKLVRLRLVVAVIVGGAAAAVVGLIVNREVASLTHIDGPNFVRYVAPVVEELIKCAVVALLIVRNRVAFLVDAAIVGFAAGAGFSALENLHYMTVLHDQSIALWIVRGFGTALMHGSVTAIMAIISIQFKDLRGATKPWVFAPGLVLAVFLHSIFNHFFIAPTVTTILILIALPAFFVLVFQLSEKRTRDWLGTGFDTDAELLEIIVSGGMTASSRVGSYLQELRERFPPATVVDMVCLLRLRVELSIRAKGILLARQSGFELPADPQLEARFAELQHLEHEVGRTGLLALAPLFHFSDRDLWQYHMLGKR